MDAAALCNVGMYSSIMYYILLYFNLWQRITLGDTDFRTESHKYSKFDILILGGLTHFKFQVPSNAWRKVTLGTNKCESFQVPSVPFQVPSGAWHQKVQKTAELSFPPNQ